MKVTTMGSQAFTFKIVIGGAGGAGKTTFLKRYVEGSFKADTALTIGVTFSKKDVTRSDTLCTLALWDLGGQDRFRFMQKSYCRGARAGLVFFDMTRPDTIVQAGEWVSLFRGSLPPDQPIILVGGKSDLIQSELIDTTDALAKKFVEVNSMTAYFSTSSKTGVNVDEVFNQVIDLLLECIQRNQSFATCTQ